MLQFKKIFPLIFLVLIVYVSCSPTDNPEEAENSAELFEVSVFAKDRESVFQVDLKRNNENPTVTNLSETMGAPFNYNDLKIKGSGISFFRLEGSSYAVSHKNVATGNIINSDLMCEPGESEMRLFPIVSENELAMVTSVKTGENQYENYLKIYEGTGSACDRILLQGIDIRKRAGLFLHQGKVFAYQQEGTGVFALIKLNRETGEQEEKITFDTEFRVSMNEENIFIVFPEGNWQSYSLENFSPQNEGDVASRYLIAESGIYNYTFHGDRMTFQLPYPQPSALASAPAVYDWAENEVTHGGDSFLLDVLQEAEREMEQSLRITTTKVNLENNIIVAGYEQLRSEVKGGILYLTFDGEIIENVRLDLIPFEIMITK